MLNTFYLAKVNCGTLNDSKKNSEIIFLLSLVLNDGSVIKQGRSFELIFSISRKFSRIL